jgi:hypothetical protein
MSEILDEKWNSLRSSNKECSEELGIPTLPLEISTAHGVIRLALGDKDQSRLLVPIDMAAQVPKDLETNGLKLSTLKLTVKNKPVRFVDLICLEEKLDDVFKGLTEDVVRRVSAGSGPLSSIGDAISEFRRLVDRAKHGSVQMETVLGLLGELMFLKQILVLNPSSTSKWTGPTGARHDFVNGKLAVEIKTSVRAHEPVVEIHAIDQLEPSLGGELFLVHYIVEENPGGELSVPELVDEVSGKVKDSADLQERLLKANYDSKDRAQWEKYRFSMKQRGFYRVAGDFPRIVHSSFSQGSEASGVSHIRYRVNLNYAKDYIASEEDRDDCMKRISA